MLVHTLFFFLEISPTVEGPSCSPTWCQYVRWRWREFKREISSTKINTLFVKRPNLSSPSLPLEEIKTVFWLNGLSRASEKDLSSGSTVLHTSLVVNCQHVWVCVWNSTCHFFYILNTESQSFAQIRHNLSQTITSFFLHFIYCDTFCTNTISESNKEPRGLA